MVRYKYKAQRDEAWLASKRWVFPYTLHPDSAEETARRKAFKPLSAELEEARRQHMLNLHQEGASYALIGRLYRLDRSLVRKIIIGKD